MQGNSFFVCKASDGESVPQKVPILTWDTLGIHPSRWCGPSWLRPVACLAPQQADVFFLGGGILRTVLVMRSIVNQFAK